MEDLECGDRPEGVPGGGRIEVGGAVLTIVEQNRKKTWFWTLRWRWLGSVPGDGGILETKIDRSGVSWKVGVWERLSINAWS